MCVVHFWSLAQPLHVHRAAAASQALAAERRDKILPNPRRLARRPASHPGHCRVTGQARLEPRPPRGTALQRGSNQQVPPLARAPSGSRCGDGSAQSLLRASDKIPPEERGWLRVLSEPRGGIFLRRPANPLSSPGPRLRVQQEESPGVGGVRAGTPALLGSEVLSWVAAVQLPPLPAPSCSPRVAPRRPGPSAHRTPIGTPHPRLAGPPDPPPQVTMLAGRPAAVEGLSAPPRHRPPRRCAGCPGVYSCLSTAGGLAEFSVGVAHQAAAVTAGPAYGSHLRGIGGQIGARWGGGRGREERRDTRR